MLIYKMHLIANANSTTYYEFHSTDSTQAKELNPTRKLIFQITETLNICFVMVNLMELSCRLGLSMKRCI